MLIVFILCVFAYANDTTLKKEVVDEVKKQMQKEYTKSFNSQFEVETNVTKAREMRMKELNGALQHNKQKQLNITVEIGKIDNKLKALKEEVVGINATITKAKENAIKEKKEISNELKEKIIQYEKINKEMKELEEKKEELNEAKLETIRAMATAKEQIDEITEQMRNRRRLLTDLEKKQSRKVKTQKIVAKVRAIEYKKLVDRIKQLENAKDEIRRLEQAQEMKQKAIEKKEAKIRSINERRRKVLLAKLKAAKIAKNAELIATVYRQLAELKSHKMKQINCARRAFEEYKTKQRILIEKKKVQLLDSKLKNEFNEKKGEYLINVKKEIQDKIDELRLEKEMFDNERKIEEKKLKAYSKIQQKELDDSKKRLETKKKLMKMKRNELLRQRMRTMMTQAQEYDNRAKRNIMQKAVDSSKNLIRKADRMNQNLIKLNAEVQMKKRLLNIKSQDATIASARERLEIQKLKDQYYRLAALRQRQKMQLDVHKQLLKHSEKMDNLEEAQRQGQLGFYTTLLKKRGIQKSLINNVKENVKSQVKLFKKQLKKEYELKKKVMNMKRCLQTRLALNNEIKRKNFEKQLRKQIKLALMRRIRASQPITCTGKNELVKKMLKK